MVVQSLSFIQILFQGSRCRHPLRSKVSPRFLWSPNQPKKSKSFKKLNRATASTSPFPYQSLWNLQKRPFASSADTSKGKIKTSKWQARSWWRRFRLKSPFFLIDRIRKQQQYLLKLCQRCRFAAAPRRWTSVAAGPEVPRWFRLSLRDDCLPHLSEFQSRHLLYKLVNKETSFESYHSLPSAPSWAEHLYRCRSSPWICNDLQRNVRSFHWKAWSLKLFETQIVAPKRIFKKKQVEMSRA